MIQMHSLLGSPSVAAQPWYYQLLSLMVGIFLLSLVLILEYNPRQGLVSASIQPGSYENCQNDQDMKNDR